MLVATCRHCHARFRVTPEQLNLRQGQVRCGQCREVFNGFESLERFPGDDTGAHLLAARAAMAAERARAAASAEPDYGRRLEPAPEPSAPSRVSTPTPGTHAGAPDIPDIPDIPDVPDLALADAEPSASRVAEPAAPERPRPAPPAADLAVAYAPLPAERPSRAWVFGVVFLSLVLGLQLAYAFRARLAQQYPVLRPVLESACAQVNCTVPWVNEESALKLEDSELLEVPGKPGQIALQARIRNLSASAQEFPHLELTLTDVSGQTAVRRVLRPADYLGRVPVSADVMAGGSEALLSVRLETGNLRPTGYELLLFYP
ncbi:MAG: zinc-ribbon and DUF3426 domain-containing protein [Burkholderiales bacterium]